MDDEVTKQWTVDEIYKEHHLFMDKVSEGAGVPMNTFNRMRQNVSVFRAYAQKVFDYLNSKLGTNYGFHNVSVALREEHTMQELLDTHKFVPGMIDPESGARFGTTDDMLRDIPVFRSEARKVLLFLAKRYVEDYNLDTVQVKLIEDDVNG